MAANRLDERQPNPARIYADLLGGIDSSAADREIARKLASEHPVLCGLARQNRRFLERAVRRVTLLDGIGRFIDLGCGPPIVLRDGTHLPMVHEVTREAGGGVPPRVAYVDRDPIVALHVSAAVAGEPRVTVIRADLADAPAVLAEEAVRELTGAGKPVGVILAATLQYWPAVVARAIVSQYMSALVSGSAAVISLACLDEPAAAERRELLPGVPFYNYDERDVRGFFGGMEYWPLLGGAGDGSRMVGGIGFVK